MALKSQLQFEHALWLRFLKQSSESQREEAQARKVKTNKQLADYMSRLFHQQAPQPQCF